MKHTTHHRIQRPVTKHGAPKPRVGKSTGVPGRFALIAGVLVVIAAHAWGQEKQPVYVGVRVCTSCHQGRDMGHPLSKWLLSKHAGAYAVLAKDEAKQIARLSGIPQEPQESPMCLGCHATGAHAEDWQKDETFHVEDGVQCEKCHGPGSEYMDLRTMIDRDAAERAGLMMPTRQDCMNCHQVKGSHVAVHQLPALDIDQAWQRIAHPVPEKWSYDKDAKPPFGPAKAGRPRYIGARACGQCHKGPQMGYAYSKWRSGPHARAYAVLATEKASKIAAEQGLTEPPQRSPACLKCHATPGHDIAGGLNGGFEVYEGVGCEACHGPGSEYAVEAVMHDKHAAHAAGLQPVNRQTCIRCHQDSHDKPFDYDSAVKKIAHPMHLPPTAQGPIYKTPINLALSPDGRELYVACEASDSVIVIDTAQRAKVAEIPVGRQPHDVAFQPDGRRAYVSNRLDDTVSVIDTAEREVVATLPAGDEPHGVLTDSTGRFLYVLNTAIDGISVFDTTTLTEVKRLAASRNPWSLSLSPDGQRIYVTNNLSRFVPFRTPPLSEVTVIDTGRAVVEDRLEVPAANLLQGVHWHPSGRFALITLNRTKNLVPMTRLLQGWTITNGLGIVWADGRVDQVLLDEPSICFPDPADVAISPDGRWALVTSSGSDRVAVVDVDRLIQTIESATEHERQHVLPNHLGKPTEFIVGHIPTKNSPRGITIDRNGRWAYVVNALDDSVTVIDIPARTAVERIDLGGPKIITQIRFGEQVFHSANIAFHRQFSCHSCHPDGHVDGLTYDIEPDGIGVNPVDNRTLRGILDTAPFKWTGKNPSLSRQCGPRLAVFFTRIEPFTPEELAALDLYICTIPRPPNRYRPLGAELTDAQRRGKAMFERTTTNDGRIIPRQQRCVTCHFPPLYTDRRSHDVDTKYALDTHGRFDAPHLNNIYDSAPYLHNGMAETLEEIWTRFNPNDQHGVTNDMTKDQLNDLIEYIKTL